jgi:hypothetical protein
MLPLEDGFSRRFYYLRLSVTDVCNFRCTYCLPDGYHPPKGDGEGRQSFLSLEEIRRVVSGFAVRQTVGTAEIADVGDRQTQIVKATGKTIFKWQHKHLSKYGRPGHFFPDPFSSNSG